MRTAALIFFNNDWDLLNKSSMGLDPQVEKILSFRDYGNYIVKRRRTSLDFTWVEVGEHPKIGSKLSQVCILKVAIGRHPPNSIHILPLVCSLLCDFFMPLSCHYQPRTLVPSGPYIYILLHDSCCIYLHASLLLDYEFLKRRIDNLVVFLFLP